VDTRHETPFERMIRECKSLGITPLTKEDFEREDRRIYGDLMHRRGRPKVSQTYNLSPRNIESVEYTGPIWASY